MMCSTFRLLASSRPGRLRVGLGRVALTAAQLQLAEVGSRINDLLRTATPKSQMMAAVSFESGSDKAFTVSDSCFTSALVSWL